jgi:hypothetical protein
MTAPQLEKMKFWIIKPSAGRNYVKNPQPYTSTGGYTISGGIRVVDSTNSRRGPGCIKVTPNSGENTILSYSGLTGTSGLAYSFSVDVLGVAGQAMRIYVKIAGVTQGIKTFTATGYWQRISVSFIATATGAVALSLQRDSVASTAAFWTDGWQFEQAVKPSTFISGDLGEGYYWEGLRRDSASTRMNYVKTGGELLDLDDYCHVVQVTGLGHGDWNQILTKMTSGGDLYQDYIRKSRQFSIVVDFIGNSLGEIEGNRKALIDALRPDLFEGEMVVRYQGFAANGDEATNPVDIHCVPLPATLTDTPDLPTYQRAVLNFSVPSGLLDGAYEEGKGLDLFAEFPAEFIVKRDPQGNWCKWNGSAYVNPLAGVNGTVYDIKEAPNGDIYVCGSFTGVSNGGSAVANTKGIARWSKANQIWGAVGDPNTGATITNIGTMAFDAAGNLYVGGTFTNLANIAAADYFAKYTVSTNTWSAVGSGLNNTVLAIVISPDGTLYIGGAFNTAGGDSNCKNIAKKSLNDSNWLPLGTGLIYTVYAMKYLSNGRVVVGGHDPMSAIGDIIHYWDGTSFHSFTELGANEFEGSDYIFSIDTTPSGTIVIGGIFTNAGGDPKANRVAAWRGNNWGALMAGGVNNTVYKVFCADNGDIYLSGYLTQAGSLTLTDRIVKSVQGAYQPLDIDLPGSAFIRAICLASDGSLYIGGDFSTAAASENAKTGAVALNLNVASASANTYPFFQIHGPGTLKSIINYSTGANVSFDGLTLQTGEYLNLWFDPTNLRFTSNWKGRGSVLRYVNAGSDYGNFYLKPGANYISLFIEVADPLVDEPEAFITWTPKFWGIDGALYE